MPSFFSSSRRRRLSKEKELPLSWRVIFILASFFVLVSLWIVTDYAQPCLYQIALPTFRPNINSQEMKEWRENTQEACKDLLQSEINDKERVQGKEKLETEAMKKFSIPEPGHLRADLPVATDRRKYEYCRYAFIDLGTNIGDSIGYFVDSALDVCSPLWSKKYRRTRFDKTFPHPHLHVSDLKIYGKGYGTNPLLGLMQKYMSMDPPMFPEDTCVYGMEGNPTFTDRLKKLENYIMDMKPRPVRHLHIHTESVVTEVDGPTKLYLDKTSVNDNVSQWGNSVGIPYTFLTPKINFSFLVLGL